MALIDKTTIVFQATGRKKQVLISWLMSQSAQWAYDANPFIIQDVNLPKKVEGETFNGTPAKDHLIARYNYLKTVFNAADIFEHLSTETEEQPEASSVEHTPSKVIGVSTVEENNFTELSEEDELRNILDSHGIKHGRVKHLDKLKEMVNQIDK
jgi:hypothetical protein